MREEDLYETGIVSLSQFKSSGQIVMYRFYTVRWLRYLVCVVCLYLKVRFKLQSLPTLQADKENTKQNTSDRRKRGSVNCHPNLFTLLQTSVSREKQTSSCRTPIPIWTRQKKEFLFLPSNSTYLPCLSRV
jgi:hypothetical protein